MKDELYEVMRLSKVVGHVRGVALVHGKRGDDIPCDSLHPW